jgi:hypothetical protein
MVTAAVYPSSQGHLTANMFLPQLTTAMGSEQNRLLLMGHHF